MLVITRKIMSEIKIHMFLCAAQEIYTSHLIYVFIYLFRKNIENKNNCIVTLACIIWCLVRRNSYKFYDFRERNNFLAIHIRANAYGSV